MSLRPTWRELEDLFWRSLWTFISSALAVPLASQVFDWTVPLHEQMLCAGMIGAGNVVFVYVRQKLGTISPQNTGPTTTQTAEASRS